MSLEITRTLLPSRITATDLDRGQFFNAQMRTGGILGRHWISVLQLLTDDVVRFDIQTQQIDPNFGPRHAIKIRHVWIDDKNGAFTVKLDYLHDSNVSPIYEEKDIQRRLDSGSVKYEGQPHSVEVRIKEASFSSDYFSMLGDEFYQA